MDTDITTIKNRLLLDQALSPEQAQALDASPELREFKDALDLALYQPAADGPQPNELVDARILGFAREQASRTKATGAGAVIHRFGVWHWVAGAMAACLVVAVTHSVWQKAQETPTTLVETPAAEDALTPASPGDIYPTTPTQTLVAAPVVDDPLSWDAAGLEREMFALQSALVVDLDRESTALAMTDMLGGI